jgi:hypothetical protein
MLFRFFANKIFKEKPENMLLHLHAQLLNLLSARISPCGLTLHRLFPLPFAQLFQVPIQLFPNIHPSLLEPFGLHHFVRNHFELESEPNKI